MCCMRGAIIFVLLLLHDNSVLVKKFFIYYSLSDLLEMFAAFKATPSV